MNGNSCDASPLTRRHSLDALLNARAWLKSPQVLETGGRLRLRLSQNVFSYGIDCGNVTSSVNLRNRQGDILMQVAWHESNAPMTLPVSANFRPSDVWRFQSMAKLWSNTLGSPTDIRVDKSQDSLAVVALWNSDAGAIGMVFDQAGTPRAASVETAGYKVDLLCGPARKFGDLHLIGEWLCCGEPPIILDGVWRRAFPNDRMLQATQR